MAKTISDEKMKFTLVIDGNVAQKQLFDLEKSTRKLTEENKALGIEKKRLIKLGKEESDEFKKLTQTIRENSAEINKNKIKMKELQNEIGITGLTLAQLTQKANAAKFALRNTIPGSEAHTRYTKELSQVTDRINELTGRAKNAGFSIGSLADKFNRYQGIAISVIAGLTGIVLSIQKIIDINGKLSEAQADVMKTTGMTKIEVDELTKSFGLLQTRTSRINLLGIAEQGGRIGISKAEIGDFVNVMNKASVALGDSFSGGAEEVSEKLGKIKFLFEETKDLSVAEAYNSIGSAINDLGANGVASEANIAEFTTRIGSLTDVLKPTIQETLALGTAFEESGIEAEVSARAYNIFMKQASTESAKFAKVMGISQASVENMINTNPLDFMLQFAKGMRGMDATDTAKTLDYLGINADGANKVIGAMGNNMGRFTELIDLSNKSFLDGTSLVNEYNVKNNNLAATLEKISKTVSGWFSSETFIKWLTVSVNVLGRLIGATEDTDNAVGNLANKVMFFIKIIAIALTTVLSYQAALQLVALWTGKTATATALSNIIFKIQYYLLVAQEVATKALAVAQALLTFKIGEARRAYSALMATMSLNPWAALIAIIAACAAAYVAFSDSADDSRKIMETQLEIANSITAQTAKQKQSIAELTAIMKDENATLNQKKKALEEIKKISNGYLEGLNLENIATAEGTRLINRYIKSIDDLAKAKAMVEIKTKLRTQILESDNKVLALSLEKTNNKNEGAIGARGKGDDGKYFGFGSRNKVEIQAEINDEKEKRRLLIEQSNTLYSSNKSEIKRLQKNIKQHTEDLKSVKKDSKAYKELVQDIQSDTNTLDTLIGLKSATEETPVSSYKVPPDADKNGNKKDPNSTAEEIRRIELENQKKYEDLYLKNQQQFDENLMNSKVDSYSKDLELENQRYVSKMQELEKQKVHNDEIIKMDDEISKARKAKNTTLENALITIKKGWVEKNKILDEQINNLEISEIALHNKKVGVIEEKWASEKIKKGKEAYDREKIIRETAFNEQLAALGNNQYAKNKLTREHEKSELEADEKYLKELLSQYNEIITNDNFQGIDLELLTPEQLEEFKNLSNEAKKALSELINKKNELSGNAAKEGAAELGLGDAGQKDILGFTNDQWTSFYEHLKAGTFGINEMAFALFALSNAWAKYNEFVEANENAQLRNFEKKADKKKTVLKRQLDSGMISQTTYNRKVELLDKEVEAKKADIEYKQAKRKKQMDIVNTIINTSVAIMQAYSQLGPIGGTIAAVLIGTIGALQLNQIRKQPLPAKGYEEGMYSDHLVKREQDGKIFKSKFAGNTRSGLVKNTSHFLVAENGPEMVIDNKAWTQMNPAVKEALINDLRGIKGWENGYYNQETKRIEVPSSSNNSQNTSNSASTNNNELMVMMMSVIKENTAVMQDLRDNGVIATMNKRNLKDMKDLNEGLNDYNSLKNKSKY